jgi:hypothetical protein
LFPLKSAGSERKQEVHALVGFKTSKTEWSISLRCVFITPFKGNGNCMCGFGGTYPPSKQIKKGQEQPNFLTSKNWLKQYLFYKILLYKMSRKSIHL